MVTGYLDNYDKILPTDVHTPKNILVNTIYSRESLTVMSHSQLLYVLLNIMPAPDVADKVPSRQPLNICVVIDTSNSMSGERLSAVKDTALNIIRSLKQQDILSVVTFDDYAQVIVPGTRNQSINVLEARISQINARGGTEIFQGLSMGYTEILSNMRPTYQNHIILITDGRTYGDEPKCIERAKEAKDQQVTIHALGIGDEWNDEFLEELTSIT
ncbi:MAG: VWA domain-containing protein, partial [Anaerolineales bacterium]